MGFESVTYGIRVHGIKLLLLSATSIAISSQLSPKISKTLLFRHGSCGIRRPIAGSSRNLKPQHFIRRLSFISFSIPESGCSSTVTGYNSRATKDVHTTVSREMCLKNKGLTKRTNYTTDKQKILLNITKLFT